MDTRLRSITDEDGIDGPLEKMLGVSQISPDAPYVVVDGKTGKVVYRTTYKNRKRARSRADRLDNSYGAYRYFCRLEEKVGAA